MRGRTREGTLAGKRREGDIWSWMVGEDFDLTLTAVLGWRGSGADRVRKLGKAGHWTLWDRWCWRSGRGSEGNRE